MLTPDRHGFFKTEKGIVINKDDDEYKMILEKRKSFKEKEQLKQRINTLEKRIDRQDEILKKICQQINGVQ